MREFPLSLSFHTHSQKHNNSVFAVYPKIISNSQVTISLISHPNFLFFFSHAKFLANETKKNQTGNSAPEGHSHFQSASAASALTAAHAIINGSAAGDNPATTMNTFPAAPTEMPCKINSVATADAMRSSQTLDNGVGSSQVSSDTTSSTIANQYHSNGSEVNNSSSNIDSNDSSVCDRKQQLERKAITIGGGGKCAKNSAVLSSSSLSSLSTSPASPSQDTAAAAATNKPNSVLQKYLLSQRNEESNKRSSLPDWFPSKRNSLILLADQNLDKLQKKEHIHSAKMVAPMQEQSQPQTANTTATFDVDSSEELQYGPGMSIPSTFCTIFFFFVAEKYNLKFSFLQVLYQSFAVVI